MNGCRRLSFPQDCFLKCTTEPEQEVGTVFGLGNGTDCFCEGEHTTQDFFSNERSTNCNSPCGGHNGIACGGVDEMSVFSVEQAKTPRYELLGCYVGLYDMLVSPSYIRTDMTPEVRFL